MPSTFWFDSHLHTIAATFFWPIAVGATCIALQSSTVRGDELADLLDMAQRGVDLLWPADGVSSWTVEEDSQCTDKLVNGETSQFINRNRYQFEVSGVDCHVFAFTKADTDMWQPDYEWLDRGDEHLRLHDPGDRESGMLRENRRDSGRLRFYAQSTGELITGTIRCVDFPRLCDFLREMAANLRVVERRPDVVVLAGVDPDGTKWQLDLQFLPDGLVVPQRISRSTTYESGKYKSADRVVSDVVLGRAESGQPFLASCRLKWRSELRDGFVRETETELRVMEFSHDPAAATELSFRNLPPDGARVSNKDSAWLHHEWRDGKVVQVTDPDAMKRMDEFKFSNQGIGWKRWALIIGSIALAGGGFLLFRRRSAAVLLVAVLSSGDAWAKEAARQEFDYSKSGATPSSGLSATFSPWKGEKGLGVDARYRACAFSEQMPEVETATAAANGVRLMGWDEPYCGIVSAYAVLQHFRKAADFKDLITVDYVGSWEGSTGVQVKAALAKYGIESVALTRTNLSTLLACSGPVILHTRSRTSPLYRHWVTYFGRDADGLKILDPSHGMLTLSPAELQAQWDGLMIAPTASLATGIPAWMATSTEYVPFAAAGLLVVLVAGYVGRNMGYASSVARHVGYASSMPPASGGCEPSEASGERQGEAYPTRRVDTRHSPVCRQGISQAAVLTVSGLLLGFMFSGLMPGGLNRSDAAVATVAGLHPGEFLKEVSLKEVQQFLLKKVSGTLEASAQRSENLVPESSRHFFPQDVVLVDCRDRASVEQGTIPAAINIPVDATAAFESAMLQGIPKNVPLILFCQSEHCSYDELVARRMIGRGYSDVRLFHGGYREWKASVAP